MRCLPRVTLPAEWGSLVFTFCGSEASSSLSQAGPVPISIRSVRVRSASRGILISDGHEAEAKAAQLRKRPNRVGLFFLRVLGFRGKVAPPTSQGGHAESPHQHPVHHEQSVPDK